MSAPHLNDPPIMLGRRALIHPPRAKHVRQGIARVGLWLVLEALGCEAAQNAATLTAKANDLIGVDIVAGNNCRLKPLRVNSDCRGLSNETLVGLAELPAAELFRVRRRQMLEATTSGRAQIDAGRRFRVPFESLSRPFRPPRMDFACFPCTEYALNCF
jgi:hypothetical protein